MIAPLCSAACAEITTTHANGDVTTEFVVFSLNNRAQAPSVGDYTVERGFGIVTGADGFTAGFYERREVAVSQECPVTKPKDASLIGSFGDLLKVQKDACDIAGLPGGKNPCTKASC